MEGNQQLTLYANFTPNVEGSVHLRYTDIDEYIYYINALYAVGEYVPVDNYRLNTNTLKVSFDYFMRNSLDYRKITYLHLTQHIGEENPKTIHTFYLIKSCTFQSGYVVYTIEIDYWATYQFLLDNGKLQLNRCNALLANETMVYDEIAKVETPFETNPINYSRRVSLTGDTRRYLDNSYFYVVFIVEYVSVRNLANTDYVKVTDLFAINLSTLISSLGDNVATTYTSADLASIIISGVTSTSTNIGGVNNDAKVIGAYIVPNQEALVSSNLSAYEVEFIYKTMFTGSTEKKFTASHMHAYRRDLPYYALLSPNNSINDGIDYKYYAGCFHNYMQLINYRKSNGVQFSFSFVFAPSKVQLIVSQGENSKDITNAITLPLIGNVEISDALQTMCYIADGLGMALNNAKGIMASKNYGELALNVADSLLDNFKFFKGNVNADMGVSQGDALTELGYTHNACYHPFNIMYFKSLNDEKYNARVIGANVNATIDNIDVLDGLTLIGSTPTGVTFDKYYVRGNLIYDELNGCPLDAFNAITNKLRNGLHLKFVHSIA